MPHISERDDLFFFFWSSLHFGKEIRHLRGCVKLFPPFSKNGKKWSILLNHPPNAQHRFAPLLTAKRSSEESYVPQAQKIHV